MNTDYEQISLDTPFLKIMDLTVRSSHTDFFVVDKDERLLGAISINEVRKVLYESESLESIVVAYDILTPIQHYFTPDDTLDIIMKAFSELNIDELPVVNNESEKKLVGTISKNSVIEAYNSEMLKRDTVSSVSSYVSSLNKLKQVQLLDGQIMGEIEIPGEFVNRTLRELDLRNRFGVEVILIKQNYSKKKERQNVIPAMPDYRFQLGDTILVLGSTTGLKNITQKKME